MGGALFHIINFVTCFEFNLPQSMFQVMLGGEWFEELFGSPSTAKEDTIEEAALKTLHEHLGISQEPTRAIVNIHKVHQCVCVCVCVCWGVGRMWMKESVCVRERKRERERERQRET